MIALIGIIALIAAAIVAPFALLGYSLCRAAQRGDEMLVNLDGCEPWCEDCDWPNTTCRCLEEAS